MASAQLERLRKRLDALAPGAARAVQPVLTRSGLEMKSRMVALAPEDTGALKDSIAVSGPGQMTPPHSQPGGSMVVPDNAVAITVGGTDVRYPHLVEYGTSNTPAQPFFWPAYRLLKKRIRNRIKRSISKAVREEWRK